MTFENGVKGAAALVALLGFFFGVLEFLQVQAVEAEKPYLEKKLAWCEEAVETTSRIANASEPSENDQNRFWQMYWGVMGLIEKESVTNAMVDFGRSLRQQQPAKEGSASGELQSTSLRKKSLALAHACRKELSLEWSPSWSTSR